MHSCGLNFNIVEFLHQWIMGWVERKLVKGAFIMPKDGDIKVINHPFKKVGKQRVLPEWWNLNVTQHWREFSIDPPPKKICTAGFFLQDSSKSKEAMRVARCATWNELFWRWTFLPELNIKASLKKLIRCHLKKKQEKVWQNYAISKKISKKSFGFFCVLSAIVFHGSKSCFLTAIPWKSASRDVKIFPRWVSFIISGINGGFNDYINNLRLSGKWDPSFWKDEGHVPRIADK